MYIKEEEENLHYLKVNKFDKTLLKLVKKLKGKRIIIYGAGTLFWLIKKRYDITELNIVGVADKKFETSEEKLFENEYKIFKLNEITKDNTDCILVSLKYYLPVLEELYDRFKTLGIKVLPFVKKSFWTILKEL